MTICLSYAQLAESCAALTPLCRPIRTRVEDGAGGRDLIKEIGLLCSRYTRQRGA